MSEVHTLCSICGKPANHVCSRCGKHVCSEHYTATRGICTSCIFGRGQ
ncbi:MAG: zinc finger HIT domain-containing protein [Candidatus Micrarchaeota archaeon]|nr:zinc finger HIT domain-containing protein [Candidatus Micrarchaeota archaeon]